jgi:hypothetical protein
MYAAAATITVSPVKLTVQNGDAFSVRYVIDPQGEKGYTAKLVLRMPPDILKVESFQFGDSWIPLSQPGYDSIDAVNGTLIKTAGYPGGVSAPTLFATIRFRAIGLGSSAITIQNDSLVLDATNTNVLDTSPVTTTVIVSAKEKATIVPEKTPVTPTASATPQERPNLFDVNIQSVPDENSFRFVFAVALAGMVVGIMVLWLKRKRILLWLGYRSISDLESGQ